MKGAKLVLLTFFLCCHVSYHANTRPQIPNRSNFYLALQSNNLQTVDSELITLSSKSGNLYAAYQGALKIKKSGLIVGGSEKLSMFKEGREQLEAAIKKDPANPELRFVRLVVQEKSPKGLGYNKQLAEDGSFVESHFKLLEKDLKKEVLTYSKNSEFLKTNNLNE